jgi:hypothetical protein
VADQLFQRRGVRRAHLQQQRVAAGDVVALEHLGPRGDLLLHVADAVR